MISSAYLSELAQYTNKKITKVVVNDSKEIQEFLIKQVSAHCVEMEYIIPKGSVTEVTTLELRSSRGEVISHHEMRLPMTSDMLIR